jgi:nucleolar protein 12
LYKREASLRDAEPDPSSRQKGQKRSRKVGDLLTSSTTADTDSPFKETTFSENAFRRIKSKRDAEQEARTVFVGNVALTVSKKTLLRMFNSYGKIESIRLRSVPVADLKLPKKASVIMRKFHPSRQSANAYIVFVAKESAENALSLNGTELEGLHIRVDMAATSKKKHDHKHSVFIGNLPFGVEEELVRKHFEVCGDVTAVRLIRDKVTGAGKGIGYVTFSDASSVSLALSLNNQPFAGRTLRIERSMQKKKPLKKSKDGRRTQGTPGNTRKTDLINRKNKKSSTDVAQDLGSVKRHRQPQTSDDTLPLPSKQHARTVIDHRKLKEQKKKKLRKKALGKKKASLGQLLTKKKQVP